MEVAILGYGTVGSGVYKVLTENAAVVAASAGEAVNVKYVLDLRDFPGDPVQEKIVHDYQIILDDPEVRIVAEVMGGVEPAYTFIKKALMAGKSAATSNKELVAKHGADLIQLAKDNGQNFMFEASVGGGIPIIRPMIRCLTADVLLEISGIVNGTTNYMLTRMDRQGAVYDVVLKEAQAMGYAELHPEADVEGYDAARKLAILASLASGHQVDFEDIYTEGITKITYSDFKYAKAMKRHIKLIAKAANTASGTFALVAPMLVAEKDPLYGISDVFNAISVKGNMLGDVMFYGRGAGKEPTASAVVSDIIDNVRNMGRPEPIHWSADKAVIHDIMDYECRYLIRVKDGENLKLRVLQLFGDADFVSCVPGEMGFVTPVITKAAAMEKMQQLGDVLGSIMLK